MELKRRDFGREGIWLIFVLALFLFWIGGVRTVLVGGFGRTGRYFRMGKNSINVTKSAGVKAHTPTDHRPEETNGLHLPIWQGCDALIPTEVE